MAFIAHKEQNFRKFILRHFGIALPEGVELFYSDGVRVGSRSIIKSGIHGDKGYAACDAGFNPTNSFIQNFGHLASKNIVDLDGARAREFALGRGLGGMELGQKSGFVILRHNGFAIGLGLYESEKRKVRNLIPEKRRRNISDSIKAFR